MANPPGATHYIPVTTNPAKVPSAQTNFTADLIIDEALAINDEGDALAFVRALAGDYSDLQLTNEAGDVNWSFNVDEFDQTVGTTKLVGAIRIPSLSGAVGVVPKLWRGCTGGPFSSGPNTYRTADDWVARYSLKEAAAGTGTPDVYKDSTANANDGDDWVSALGKSGQVGDGQQSDGNDDYIVIPDADSLDMTSGTYMLWFRADSITRYDGVIDRDIAGYNADDYRLWFFNATNEIVSSLEDDLQYYHVESDDPITIGQWYHVATTYDASTLRMYIDGVLQADTESVADLNFGCTTADLWFANSRSVSTRCLDGYLDEICIASVTRSPDWITTLFNAQDDNDAFWTVGAEQGIASIPVLLRCSRPRLTFAHMTGVV